MMMKIREEEMNRNMTHLTNEMTRRKMNLNMTQYNEITTMTTI
jgi:hypothetical protein